MAFVAICGCWATRSRDAGGDGLAGDARDRQLLGTGIADYMRAKFAFDFFGSRHRSLVRAQALFEEVLNDGAASPKSKREAADMLAKVNARLNGGSP